MIPVLSRTSLLLLLAGALHSGCAGGRFAVSDSGNSSADSSGQSQSENSTGQSQSEGSSGASSDSSGDSANSSQDSLDSTEQSDASTKGSSADNASGESTEASIEQTSAGSMANITLPLLSTTVVGGTITLLGLVIWGVAGSARMPIADAAHGWTRSNEYQLAQDLSTGSGPAIRDLAAVAGIRPDHLDRFGELLRRERRELMSLVEASRHSREASLELFRSVGAIARADDLLHEDYVAFRARHAAEVQ